MDEERTAILRMVAEKKISTEEAARLLDALMEGQATTETWRDKTSEDKRGKDRYNYNYNDPYDYSSPHDRAERRSARHRAREERRREREHRRTRRQAHWQEKLGEMAHMFEDMFGEAGLFGTHGVFTDSGKEKSERTLSIPEGCAVHIACTAGKLTVRGTDGDQLRVRVEGDQGGSFMGPRVHQDTEAKRVDIVSVTQNIIVEAPWQMTALHAAVSGGNLLLSDVSSDLYLVLNGGKLKAHDVTGRIDIRVSGGKAKLTDIHSSNVDVRVTGGAVSLAMDVITEGAVTMHTVGGKARLRLPETSAFEVDAKVTHGKIRTNLVEDADALADAFHAVHNGGGAMISISTQAGDIDLEVTDTAATERIDDEKE